MSPERQSLRVVSGVLVSVDEHGVVRPGAGELEYQSRMSGTGGHCPENAFSIDASETEQDVADSLTQSLASGDVLRHGEVGTEDEFVRCVHARIREKQTEVVIDWNLPLIYDRSVVADVLPYLF